MRVQSRESVIYSCSYIGHSFQVTELDESSEVKVLVRSANNISGRSIKRKLQCRKFSALYSTWAGIMDVEPGEGGRRLISMGKK